MISNQIFTKYSKRQSFLNCPLCMAPIKWATDGVCWYPCDDEPVLFVRDIGYEKVLKKGDLITKTKILRPGMKVPGAAGYEYGLEPHVFTCKKIKRRFSK